MFTHCFTDFFEFLDWLGSLLSGYGVHPRVKVAIGLIMGSATILGFVAEVIPLRGWLKHDVIEVAGVLLLGSTFVAATPLIVKLRRSRQFVKYTDLQVPFRSAEIIPARLEDMAVVADQERNVYLDEDAVPEALLREWFVQNRNGFNIIRYKKQNIGHVNLLPLKKSFLARLEKGEVIEKEASASDLYSPLSRRYIKNVYVESIIIAGPSDIVVSRVLTQVLSEFAKIVSRLCPMEQVGCVYALAAIAEGRNLLEKLDFEHIRQKAKGRARLALYCAKFSDLAAILSESGDNARQHEALKAAKSVLRKGL